jgi:hypothetical protein
MTSFSRPSSADCSRRLSTSTVCRAASAASLAWTASIASSAASRRSSPNLTLWGSAATSFARSLSGCTPAWSASALISSRVLARRASRSSILASKQAW